MGEYKGDMRGWGTSDRSGEGGEKLCIRERWENEHFSFEKKIGYRRTNDLPGERVCAT